jgi:uncharacterized protein (DUF1684 family)
MVVSLRPASGGHRVFPLAALVVTASVVAGCSSGPGAPVDAQAYSKQILEARAVKDRAFREDPEPIPPAKRDKLLPLRYFPPDPSYSVPAELKLADDRPIVVMPTSTGKPRRMQRVGVLEFSLRGEEMALAAFVPEGEKVESLFVPFVDLTTGKETYPAGRYLDLHPTTTGYYTIDFNLAYNPTCAYNEAYECPYPPPSNRLKVEIRAGEKAPGT